MRHAGQGATVGLTKYLQYGLLGAFALIFAGARLVPGSDVHGTGLLQAATRLTTPRLPVAVDGNGHSGLMAKTTAALTALAGAVRPLSHPRALESAFRSYFAYMAAHPDEVKKPVLYFVDYGLPSTEPRGYIFDMRNLSIIEGPFAVAHGRGSSRSQYGIPDRFSNAPGSAATSLGLYLPRAPTSSQGTPAGMLTARSAYA